MIQNHISTVVGRYKGKSCAWDVVNEVFGENGQLESNVFCVSPASSSLGMVSVTNTLQIYDPIGPDFVSIAFNAAKAKLYIDDFNLDTPTHPKITDLAAQFKTWISQGIPTDGSGSQSNLNAGRASESAAALAVLAVSVSETAMTELDIAGAAPADYTQAVGACLNQPKCVGITIWVVRDPDSWRASSTPLLFDANWNPKQAYNAIEQLLHG